MGFKKIRTVLPLRRKLTGALAASGAILLTACSSPDVPTDVYDPYENVNRVTHDFNVGLDRIVVRPTAQAYGAVVPAPVRRSLDNAANNLGAPASVVNSVLQGNIEDAGHTLTRFMINTTIGLFGLFDPAANDFGLENRNTGFGDTLAAWGTPEGAYSVLPVYGPSTERDAAGLVVDILTNPVETLFGSDAQEVDRGLTVTGALNYRYTFGDTIDSVLYDSADSYTQLRLFYLDSRRFSLGTPDAEAGADIYEDLYDGLYEE